MAVLTKTQVESPTITKPPSPKTIPPTTAIVEERPWYRRGGMHVNMVGMAINIFTPVLVLSSDLKHQKLFYVAWLGAMMLAILQKMTTVYCIIVVPTFFSSLWLLGSFNSHPLLLLTVSVGMAIVKVNICMSVCLHRYAAHGAFQCSPIFSKIILILGCMANQGGPIWWASQHKCHHVYCDVKRDPHSPMLSGIERAFGFFEFHQDVEEEFAPKRLESYWNRVLDTWAWVGHGIELVISYLCFGREGLFLVFTAGWICQCITLWFNIVNHPVTVSKKCKASDGKHSNPDSWYLPFWVLDSLYHLFGVFVAEGEHQHHHDHAGLAKRCKYDTAYWFFLFPLEKMGLIWNVNV